MENPNRETVPERWHHWMKATPLTLGSKERSLPELWFETEQLTMFSGLVIIQQLFERVGLARRLQQVFRSRERGTYRFWKLFLLLIVHRILGFRRLRDAQGHRADPLLKQVVGLPEIPDVSTLSRRLRAMDEPRVGKAHEGNRQLVLDGLAEHRIRRFTLDFDGSVLSTRRHAQGSAVGFNRKRKGERSYYPLLCTVAQSAQVFDFVHRPGNVHDSQEAEAFMRKCLEAFRRRFPGAALEVRGDSAFFNERLVQTQEDCGTEFTFSVPFERFPRLKGLIQTRQHWERVDEKTDAFELDWKPACWQRQRVRLIAVRTRQPNQRKGPLQLDLFVPVDSEYQYQVVATNKPSRHSHVIAVHHGRGSQEGIIGELKSALNLDYVPCGKQLANETFLLSGVYAHNLLRALQMQITSPQRERRWKRPACWIFEKAQTLRTNLLLRAGRLSQPGNRKKLTISGDAEVAAMFAAHLEQLGSVA